MPHIRVHKGGQVHEADVKENANLVVLAGIRQFPYPHLAYGCGMGKCGKCRSRILAGAEHLAAPNWKEQKTLGPLLGEGCRLLCQLWLSHDLELTQEGVPALPQAAPAAKPGTAP
jgi:ferredoxin